MTLVNEYAVTGSRIGGEAADGVRGIDYSHAGSHGQRDTVGIGERIWSSGREQSGRVFSVQCYVRGLKKGGHSRLATATRQGYKIGLWHLDVKIICPRFYYSRSNC